MASGPSGDRARVGGFAVWGVLLAATFPLAVWLAVPLRDGPSLPAEPTTGSASISLVVIALFLAFAALMMALVVWAARTGRTRLLQGMLVAATAGVLAVLLVRPALALSARIPEAAAWGLAFLGAGVVAWRSWHATHWLARDLFALLLAAAAAAVLGALLPVWTVLLLLAALAGFDLWAVHRGDRMEKVAEAAERLRLPLVLSPPTAKGQQAAMLMGIGDLVFPAALVVAAADPAMDWGAAPALAAALGTLAGYLVIVRRAPRVRVQAGIPWLAGGAAAGFFAGLVGATGSLRFW